MESEHDAYGDRDSDTRLSMSAYDPAGPQLRDGLFRAPAELKGVTVGTVKDSAGPTGTEPAFHGGVGTAEVIIDPKAGTLLELREPWRSERDQRQATYLSVGLTDTTG